MELTPQSSNPITITLTRIALGLLIAAVVLGELVVVISAQSAAELYPEFARLHAPLVFAAIAFGVCVETVLIVTGVLVGYTRDDRIFGATAFRLVDVLIAAIAVATLIVLAVLVVIPGPPPLALLLMGGALAGAAIALVLLVLRSLLRGAMFMRVELDEVV